MSLQIRLKNSGIQGKEPLPADLTYSELAINWNANEPFLAIKDSTNTIRRIAGVRIGATAPNTPTHGEMWLDTSTATYSNPALKIYLDNTSGWITTDTDDGTY
jgi:hypothetical protein